MTAFIRSLVSAAVAVHIHRLLHRPHGVTTVYRALDGWVVILPSDPI